MTEASFPVVSVVKVCNEQQPTWNRIWPRKRPNRLAGEGDGPPKRRKVRSWYWNRTRLRCHNGESTYGPPVSVGHHSSRSHRTGYSSHINSGLHNFRFAGHSSQLGQFALPRST